MWTAELTLGPGRWTRTAGQGGWLRFRHHRHLLDRHRRTHLYYKSISQSNEDGFMHLVFTWIKVKVRESRNWNSWYLVGEHFDHVQLQTKNVRKSEQPNVR